MALVKRFIGVYPSYSLGC